MSSAKQDVAAALVDIRVRCGAAVARGGDFWQEFMADAERRTGLPWMRIKALLDEQYAQERALADRERE